MKKITNAITGQISNHPKLSEFFLFVLIFVISLLIRRIGLKHGFPILTHADESAIIDPVLKMTRLHTLNPGNFNRPDQILYYLNFVYLNIISFISYGMNVYWAFDEHYLTFYFHSRLLISILGSIIPIVAYKIGKEISNKLALPAAIVFAAFPIYAEHALYITPDIPITLFTLLVIYFACKYINSGHQKFLLFGAIFSAINTAEKYPGVISLAIPLVALAIHTFSNRGRDKKIDIRKPLLLFVKVILTFIITLLIVAPFLFIEYKSVIQALITESRSTHLGADNLGWLGNMWFYIKTFYANINLIGALFFAIGAFALIKSWNRNYILLLYGGFYWIVLSKLALHWERWALPMFITPLFLIILGISFLWEKTKQNRVIKLVTGLIIGIFIFQQGVHTLYIPIRQKLPDTRIVSSSFCEANGITTENSIFEGYTPLVPPISKWLFTDYLTEFEDKEYILLSSSIYNRFFAEPERYTEYIEIYNEIRENNILISQYQPYPEAKNTLSQIENIIYFLQNRLGLTEEKRYSGPIIEIYEIVH